MKESNSIKHWAENDRPREKLLRYGPQSLSDSELLAILLRTGTRNHNVLELSRHILAAADNSLDVLGRSTAGDFARIEGLGPAKALTLVAAFELGRRRQSLAMPQKAAIKNSQDAAIIFQSQLCDLSHEEFWILLLNRANRIIGKKGISKGGIAGTVVDPKIIFREALEARASGIILCHNHPSGNTQPSEADVQLTKKIKEAGRNLEITVLDHLIIAGSSFYSFADEGVL